MKHTRLIITTCAAALAAGIASPVIAGDVSGFVVDGSDTVALQAAEVTIVELGRTAKAENDGSFFFGNVPEGTYTIVASYVGAESVSQTVEVPATGVVRVNFSVGSADGEILVVGQSANLASALSRKRNADGVSDVLTRDAIGQFPDQNVAESLRRVPGVNVLNDQGEGRFVSVRGLDPGLNATSLNGVRLPAPEGDVRSVALDVISSDIIESIEIKKSLTPDMDGDTIGASIEINTTSAFSRKKDLLTAKVEGSYNRLADALTPKGSVDFATKLSDNFGVSGGVSFYRRKFETDNIEADDWEDVGSGPFATEVQYRDYDVERERFSATLGFDFRIGDSTELYAKGVWSQFDDQEFRRRLTFDLGDFDGGASSQTGTTATFSDADEEFTVERDVKDRFERQRVRSIVLGGETETNGWRAEYSLAYSKSSELENGSVDPTQFERDFDNDGLIVGFDYSDPRVPLYSVTGSTADFFDPARYELKDVELTVLSDAQDEEWAAKFDLAREFLLDSGSFTVQAGFKGRWREKSFNKNVEFYEYDGPGDYTLGDVVGTQTYRITDLSPLPDAVAPTIFFRDNFNLFELQDADSQFDSAVEDYRVDEDVMAGYLLGRLETDSLLIIGGVRYERTDNVITGNNVTLFEEDATLPDGSTAADDTVIVTPTTFDRDYEHWLPSLNIRYEAQDDLIVRLAGYRSIVRPRLGKLAPRFAVEVNDDDEIEGEFGNPGLVPFEAWNFDATAEYYMSSNGAITAGFFYKDITNFIVDAEVDTPGVFNGIAFDEAVIPINGPSGEVFGVELGFAQSFDFLPGILSGLILQANYTFTDATGSVPDGSFTDVASVDSFRDVPLPSSSRHTFNGVIGYEKGPLEMRLAGTYRDKYLDELGGSPSSDRYVDDHFQLDFSAKFKVNENIKLFYEWININYAKYFAYNNLGGQQNLYQYEEYNWTMKFGARVTF
ncbi:TonB-dependent receptor [Pontixanthobacter aestiaquae]|uniref:TonB-dependent receptor n=1 Tax=Pontixanthobacter aestiaquae TaxID=1509367 RepID=A0A844Z539_9SPHN|nr:TonB-dependent receptor [Pontixanthobacter aestiaquae]MDN3646396.1 TonB-dependent receptor [Pontixanthobacter aestiaquae]MXO82614.1 TonB-dependent receptor [Pontixanthobacter aestiaquae]